MYSKSVSNFTCEDNLASDNLIGVQVSYHYQHTTETLPSASLEVTYLPTPAEVVLVVVAAAAAAIELAVIAPVEVVPVEFVIVAVALDAFEFEGVNSLDDDVAIAADTGTLYHAMAFSAEHEEV